MNTPAHAIPEKHPMPPATPESLQNDAISQMMGCAMSAVQSLRGIGIGIVIVSITVHGAKPVIEVVNGPGVHRLTTLNSSDWQSFMGTCPVSQRRFIQVFVNFRGCMVTWIRWG